MRHTRIHIKEILKKLLLIEIALLPSPPRQRGLNLLPHNLPILRPRPVMRVHLRIEEPHKILHRNPIIVAQLFEGVLDGC
jgi:hypothetical protein